MIPPKRNDEFAARTEDIIDPCCQAYNPEIPVVCMDERLRQLVKLSIPAEPGKPKRVDYEYERGGTANIFLFTEPLSGQRYVSVTERRTAVDWVGKIDALLTDRFPDAEKVRPVCDNLNTHKTGSLYEAFPPGKARCLAERLEIRYTPKHGSWLNIAEIELRAMTRQCLDRRIPDIETLRRETEAWERRRNEEQRGVDWQFTAEDARIKLKRLYPEFNS